MKITLEFLEQECAPTKLIEYFKENNLHSTDIFIFLEKLKEDGKLYYATCILTRLFNRTTNAKFAIFAAEQVLPIFEEKYPDDERPQAAIDAAKKCVGRNNSSEDYPYSDAAFASAAIHRTNYAHQVYDCIALAASYACDAASSFSVAAASAHAYIAAIFAYTAAEAHDDKKELKTKIINYGIELLKQQLEDENEAERK